MTTTSKRRWIPGLLVATWVMVLPACDDDPATVSDTVVDAAAPNGPPDAASGPACFANPATHAELINACTDAVKIEKNPTLPLLRPDGTLPPLP
ncbi:MAG: hypothetical protein SF187_02105 [Deltaproteobacteria bacterium]|nr:hypothetical protein [Deltaproteobacteria bacterium]